jgi:RHS repeat-associated protein
VRPATTHTTNPLHAFSVYRFHFNGKETDNELYGEGNALDFGARIYSSRLGGWLSIDPLSHKYPAMSPYAFCFINPINVIDIDGKEGIVVSGQPGDHKNKNHFLINGLDRAKKLSKQFKKEGKGETVTWFIYNGGGEGGFDAKTLEKYKKQAAKHGITVHVVNDADKIVEYVNEKTGGDSRANDKVSNFFYFGHATPGDLDVGFEDHGVWNMMTNDKIEPSDFSADAFKKGCMINVVGGCRTAVDGNLLGELSVVDQFVKKVDPTSTVKGSNVRVDYPGGVRTDEQLVAPNNGQVIVKKGTSSQ